MSIGAFDNYRQAGRRRGSAALILIAAALLYLWREGGSGPNQTAGPEQAADVSGRVAQVHDGDTFTMTAPGNKRIKVRLFGLDAPELDQAHGRESRRYLRELIEGREVRVTGRGLDQYGRLLGLVHRPDGYSLSRDLAAAGQVWVYENYCDIDLCAQLREAQAEARYARRGLWSGQNPVAPWQYRRANK
jgi:endonuclease YncB( thermonuclease family)